MDAETGRDQERRTFLDATKLKSRCPMRAVVPCRCLQSARTPARTLGCCISALRSQLLQRGQSRHARFLGKCEACVGFTGFPKWSPTVVPPIPLPLSHRCTVRRETVHSVGRLV
ncbi:unnamed protein product [Ixodes persulcatus]